MNYDFFAFLSVILLMTQIMGKLSRRFNMPAVVGALIAGILLGPSVFNWVPLNGVSGGFVTMAAEIGVVLLMFTAGLETNINDLKSNLLPSAAVAVLGILFPLAGGFLSYTVYFQAGMGDYETVLTAMFMGVVLIATSVSITVEVLRELGKLSGKVGTIILGAAVIDDILGVIALSVITSLREPSAKVSSVLFNILWFFCSVVFLWWIVATLKKRGRLKAENQSAVIFALVVCFLMAWIAESVHQVADVTGAYFAGLMLSQLSNAHYIEKQSKIPLELFFSPIFFASVGLKVSLGNMDSTLWIFAILLMLVAVLTKILGCGLGAKLAKCSWKDSLRIGIGMMARGEVALIMAQKGLDTGLLPEHLFSLVVLVVLVTTLAAPVMLSVAMKDKSDKKEL